MIRLDHRTRLDAAILVAMLALAMVFGIPGEAGAIKWAKGAKSCPNARAQKFFKAGPRIESQSLFIHPGHEIGFFANARDVSRRGGFSTEPGGNAVEITFLPPRGDPIPLPPLAVTAVSPTALYFDFPDTRAVLGRLVVGRMTITIRTPTRTFTRVGEKIVALPPANDVSALLGEGADLEILAAVHRRHMWIPLQFAGFGSGEPMPICPGPLIPKTAMTIGLTMTGKDGAAIPYSTVATLRKAKMFLGDFVLDGTNYYGTKLSGTVLDVPGPHRGRVSICAMNDAIDLVLLLTMSPNATREKSRLLPLLSDGSPYRIQLKDISADVGGGILEQDSFGSRCVVP